jgi:superfamily I DNA and/or RNA helicase
VEAVKQLWARYSGTLRVLVTAPSNNAADLLLKRISTTITSPVELYRLNAYSRDRMDDGTLERFCTFDQTQNAYVPPTLENARRFVIMIATCCSAGRLVNLGLSHHFDVCVVDEAGHATEPEVQLCFVDRGSAVIFLCI